jgi:hypothetical protein
MIRAHSFDGAKLKQWRWKTAQDAVPVGLSEARF